MYAFNKKVKAIVEEKYLEAMDAEIKKQFEISKKEITLQVQKDFCERKNTIMFELEELVKKKLKEEELKKEFEQKKKEEDARKKKEEDARKKKEEDTHKKKETNPYFILQVTESSTLLEIRSKYLKLCMLFHPDKATTEKQVKEFTEKMKVINGAYEQLYKRAL